MIPVDQTQFGKGEGNCFAACIASILELNIDRVIHFPKGDAYNWRDIINDWLMDRELFFLDIVLHGDLRDELIKYWGYHIIMGISPRDKEIRHAVVGYKGKMIHDPHPSRVGLIGDDFSYGFLIPRKII